jgi:hypothetical protein
MVMLMPQTAAPLLTILLTVLPRLHFCWNKLTVWNAMNITIAQAETT